MRTITLIIIHCSAVRPYQTSTAAQIDSWHRARGWNGIGYHYVILRDGTVQPGRPEDAVGAHCVGHNAHSIGTKADSMSRATPRTPVLPPRSDPSSVFSAT